MPPQKLASDDGNATLEFVLIVGLFVGPILTANQNFSLLNQRQVSLDSMAQTLARSFALRGETSGMASLQEQLAQDAAMKIDELNTEISCRPTPICSEASSRVDVRLEYRTAKSFASQFLNETGSMMPLSLGILTLGLVLSFAAANLQSANVFYQRTEQLARFLVQEHFADSESPQGSTSERDLTDEARELGVEFQMTGTRVNSATIDRPEPKTLRALVCTSFDLPIRFFSLGAEGSSCRQAKMRQIS